MAEARKVAEHYKKFQSGLKFSRVTREDGSETTLGEIVDRTSTTWPAGYPRPTPVTEISIFNECVPLNIAHEFAVWLLEVTEDPITKGVGTK